MGAGPLWEGRNVVAEGGVVDLVYQDTEEGRSLVVRIRLEFGIDLDDEGRSYGGKQTSLWHELIRVYPHDGNNIRILTSC